MPSPGRITEDTGVSLRLTIGLVAIATSVMGAGGAVLWRLDTMEEGLGRQVTATDKLADAVRSAEAERVRLSSSIDRLADQIERAEDRTEHTVTVEQLFLWVERARMAYPDLPGFAPR